MKIKSVIGICALFVISLKGGAQLPLALSFQYFEPYLKQFKSLALPYEIKSTGIKSNIENILFENCSKIIELENKTFGLIGKITYPAETNYVVLEIEASKSNRQVYSMKLYVYAHKKNAILKYAIPHLSYDSSLFESDSSTSFVLNFTEEEQRISFHKEEADTVIFYRKL